MHNYTVYNYTLNTACLELFISVDFIFITQKKIQVRIPSKYQISNKIAFNHSWSMTKVEMYHNPFGEYAV